MPLKKVKDKWKCFMGGFDQVSFFETIQFDRIFFIEIINWPTRFFNGEGYQQNAFLPKNSNLAPRDHKNSNWKHQIIPPYWSFTLHNWWTSFPKKILKTCSKLMKYPLNIEKVNLWAVTLICIPFLPGGSQSSLCARNRPPCPYFDSRPFSSPLCLIEKRENFYTVQ